MANAWTAERLKQLSTAQVRNLYSKTFGRSDDAARSLATLIIANGLLVDDNGGLPFDHPVMLEIEEICGLPEAIAEAVTASEKGLPALAGMEHRIMAALGVSYGGNYTTNHAGRCIADGMVAKGWKKISQRPMPTGSVAKSATVFVRKDR